MWLALDAGNDSSERRHVMTVLLFIATIVMFLTIDHFVQRRKRPQLAAQPILQKAIPMRTPPGIFFANSHTWLSLFPSGNIQLGIDDFLAHIFRTPRVAMLKNVGDAVARGEPIMRLAEGNNEVVVRAPLEGVVKNVNLNLPAHPALLTEALFSEGWAYTIAPAHVSDLRKLYLGEDTRQWLKQEMARLRDFFAQAAAPAAAFLQDGGLPAAGIIHHLNPEQCKAFEEAFLQVE
jgi:glycine cleavage system H lipoate-binding protein